MCITYCEITFHYNATGFAGEVNRAAVVVGVTDFRHMSLEVVEVDRRCAGSFSVRIGGNLRIAVDINHAVLQFNCVALNCFLNVFFRGI